MEKQENSTLSDISIQSKFYLPTPLRRWFIELARRIQMSEEVVSGSRQKE